MDFIENEVIATASFPTQLERFFDLGFRLVLLIFPMLILAGSGFFFFDYIKDNSDGIIFSILDIFLKGIYFMLICYILYVFLYGFRIRKKIFYSNGQIFIKSKLGNYKLYINDILFDGISFKIQGAYFDDNVPLRKQKYCQFEGKYIVSKRFHDKLNEFYALMNTHKS
jgi:hypothetical protein